MWNEAELVTGEVPWKGPNGKWKKVSGVFVRYLNFLGAPDLLLNEKGQPDDLSDLLPSEQQKIIERVSR